MLFWIYLIFGGLTAYIGVRGGLYTLLVTFFNIMAAVYVGTLAAPTVVSMNPEIAESGYSIAACIFVLAAAVMVTLQMIGYYFFLRHSEAMFPDMLEKAGGGILGFLSGTVAISFVLLLICVMPFSKTGWLDSICPRQRIADSAGCVIDKSCHFIAWYSLECFDQEPDDAIKALLEMGKPAE